MHLSLRRTVRMGKVRSSSSAPSAGGAALMAAHDNQESGEAVGTPAVQPPEIALVVAEPTDRVHRLIGIIQGLAVDGRKPTEKKASAGSWQSIAQYTGAFVLTPATRRPGPKPLARVAASKPPRHLTGEGDADAVTSIRVVFDPQQFHTLRRRK
ncbi:hypothetical protein [Pelomonas cellulosilytica]|uniref:Uncharacterized protein n=1 Tax=Pelomonas cellulosilytica TaxID=2906762 RepID=A0ABS8Y1M9_9BURK|nr:hypothetical protein [Pelomonas sp. P8]MCE4556858.1 hypothetical protein [Pelomonas sp. P8]